MLDSLNLSTKFTKNELGDPINYKTYIHNINKSDNFSEIPTRFLNKERILKDKESINSFRIYNTNLKKRSNPSDIYQQEIYNKEKEENQRRVQSTKSHIQPSWIITNPYKSNKENLLKTLESQVNLLKEETEANLILNNNNGNNQTNESKTFSLNEPNVDTHFFNNENGVVQVFKHVKTLMKPEYMNLETLAQMREANSKKLIELEKEYKEFKDREKLIKFQEEQRQLNKKYNYKPEVLEEIKEILKKENELFHFDKKKKSKSTKNKKYLNNNSNNNVIGKSINKTQEKFIRNFAKYNIEKRLKYLEEEKEKINSKYWNYTKIKSKNIHGTVDKIDNLPGYFGKLDLSLYYYDIQENKNYTPDKFKAPHWSTITRKDLKNDNHKLIIEQKAKENQHKNEIETKEIDVNKLGKNDKKDIIIDAEKMKEIAENLTKDIFDYFNQEFIFGLVNKSQIATEFNFDHNDLIKLNFKSKTEFINILNGYKTDLVNRVNFEELKMILLYKLLNKKEINEEKKFEYKKENSQNKNIEMNNSTFNMENYQINEESKNVPINKEYDNIDNNKNEIENIDNNKDEGKENDIDIQGDLIIQDDEDNSDYLPVYNTKNIIIQYDSTEKRIRETNKLLNQLKVSTSRTDDLGKDSLEIKNDCNLDKENPKEVTYYDYQRILNKYSDSKNIDFTIPQPFDFQKNSKSRINAINRLKDLLIERKKDEERIAKEQFRANDLKTEIFIGNINNLIEADKNARKKRIEKGMKKLQESMRPFSFVHEDEEKQKIKMKNQKIYESTKEKSKQFKANPIKSSSRGGINAEQIAEKEKEERKKRIKENAIKIAKESKRPPRMEMHEEIQRIKEEKLLKEQKIRENQEKTQKKSKKNLDPPNWDKVHKFQEKKLNEKKKKNDRIKEQKATKIKEFNLHEGSKKENLYQKFIENGGQIYNEPSIKRNIIKFNDEYERKQIE